MFKVFYNNRVDSLYMFFLKHNYTLNNWMLSTNHRRISVLYFIFILLTSFSGLLLATVIRIELAMPGISILNNNAEKYLTVISLHGVVMVFFVVIPTLFGAFGNFLLPTQLGIRDVAFPRLNSFMYWVTPSGFILTLHIFLADRGLGLTTNSNNDNNLFEDIIDDDYEGDYSTIIVRQARAYKAYINDSLFNGTSGDSLVKISNLYKNILDWNTLLLFPNNDNKLGKNLPVNLSNINSIIRSNISDVAESLRTLEVMAMSKNNITSPSIINNVNSLKNINLKVSSWVSNQLIPGWAFITPYTSKVRFTSVGKVDIALVAVFSAGLGSFVSSLNYVISYRSVSSDSSNNRKELRSFFVDGLIVASRMMLAANPALLIAILFLLSDRHMLTSIFDFSGGGDAVLFQHLFWFFGHPEVYIIIIPCFGIMNSLTPYYLRKRLSGRLSLQFSMYTIAFMAFAVWGHHMYMVGLANTTRTLYSTMTVMISVPASTKVLHWCVTFINSAPIYDVPFFFLLAFTYFFTLGGLSGMFVAHIGFDILFHDTFYVIGHFHVMFAGAAISAIFAALYHYFNAIFTVDYYRPLAYLHFFFYFFGQVFTLMPMFWLGYSGMPRRVMDYPAFFGAWHSIISSGHIISVIGYIFFLILIVDAHINYEVKKTRDNFSARLNTRANSYNIERLKYKIVIWGWREETILVT